MTLRTAVALAVCALALLVLPWIIGNEFYVNMATQVLIYALFALSINMMLGYGGMVSLGHAGYLGIAGYACILAVTAGYDHLTAAIFAVALSTAAAAFFGLLSLRAPGLGFIMITLALGQIVWGIAYRANDLTGGDNGIRYPGAADAVRLRPPRRAQLLLFHARRLRRRAVLHLAVLALAVRREPDGHARPAAAHAHARLQCLADPVAHLRHGRVLGLGRRRPLRLLQSVPQPARDLAAAVGRDPADGDPRRRQHAHRPDRRRRHHHAGEERDLDLCRALEHAARRDLRGRDHVHALRAGPRLRAAVAAIAKPGQDAQGGEQPALAMRSEWRVGRGT